MNSWMFLHRLLSEDEEHQDEDTSSTALFNVAIATIFAREFLEGAVIIGQYRTVILRSDDWDEEAKAVALRTVTRSAAAAALVAILIVVAVAIPLGILSQELDETTIAIIEGVSKVVASVCILQLSVKIPVWLGIYWKVSILAPCRENKNRNQDAGEEVEEAVDQLSLKELRFNVAWNIWREVAECAVFLVPFFLGTGAQAIPLSALVGILVALVLGFGIYFANHRLSNKAWLAAFMAGLTLFMAVGLFVGGCHEFEEVAGETPDVWVIENEFWSDSNFPMVMLKPFGFSSSRTVLQIVTFWCFLSLGLLYHFLKWNATRHAKLNQPAGKSDSLAKGKEDGLVVEDANTEEDRESARSVAEVVDC